MTSLMEAARALLKEADRNSTVIRINVPTFIRMLEYVREDAPDDMALHKVTENIMKILVEKSYITMEDYDKIVKIK